MTLVQRFTPTLAMLQFLVLCSPTQAAEPPRVTLVIGDNAPALERLAAEEMQTQFQQLWQAKVQIASKTPTDKSSVILVGSPGTNPVVKSSLGKDWPKLSDQGILLRSVKSNSGTTLVVGGGSPVATYWAAAELGHQFGIRYHLHGDVYPAETPEFQLDRWNLLQEPNLRSRTWRTINDFPIGPEAWGLEEHKRTLRQLAKQKFNRVMLATYPWQPFSHYEYGGVKKQTAMLWFGYRYPIDGDTAGRAIFKGAKEFYNPDLARKKSYEELTAAGVKLMQGVIEESHRLGMTVGLSFSPLEFTKEFAAVLPEARTVHQLESLTVGPGAKQLPTDKTLAALASAQLTSFLKTYPTLDAVYLTLPEHPEWDEHTEAAWKRLDARTGIGKKVQLKSLEQQAESRTLISSGARGRRALRANITSLDFLQSWLAEGKLLQRPDGKQAELYILDVDTALYPYLDKVLPDGAGAVHFVDYTARRVAEHAEVLKTLPVTHSHSAPASPSLIFTLADDNVGVLPQLATPHLATLMKSLKNLQWAGFSTRYWISGDLDPTVHYLSRASFDASVTPESAAVDLIAPNAGAGGVAERLLIGWKEIEQATDKIDQHDLGFAFPVPNMVMKHYAATDPPPAWWQEVTDHYLNAMNEMYRAHDGADPAGRKLLYRYARRYEFALEYMTAMQAVRMAGVARAQKDADTQLAKLESAAEGLYNGLTALSTVAEDDSGYRGVIAVLTEYGYRPLLREIEKLQDAAEEK